MRIHPITAVVGCVAALTLCAPPAGAVPDPGTSASVRSAHFSPDTPSVDVYLTSFAGGTTTLALSDVGYGDISDYQRIEPGLYTIGMRPAGADPSTPVVFSWTLDAKPGEFFTACAIGMNKSLQGRVLVDDYTTPPAGQTRVRIIQAASRIPTADIVAENGPVIGNDVPFGATTEYSTVPAGSWPLTARSTDDGNLTTTTDLTLNSGRITTIVLLDAPQSGISLKTLDDVVGETPVPTGPVSAGGGATAGAADEHAWLRAFAYVMTGLTLAATAILMGMALRQPNQRR